MPFWPICLHCKWALEREVVQKVEGVHELPFKCVNPKSVWYQTPMRGINRCKKFEHIIPIVQGVESDKGRGIQGDKASRRKRPSRTRLFSGNRRPKDGGGVA